MESPLRAVYNQRPPIPTSSETASFLPHQSPTPSTTPGVATDRSSYFEPLHHVGPDEQPSLTYNKGPITGFYWRISSFLGFKERFSLFLFVIFGGALSAYCLARAEFFNWNNLPKLMMPGEWFAYHKNPSKGALIFHIYGSVFAGFWAPFQFIPAIRRKKMHLHRLNGYLTLLCLISSTLAGIAISRHAFGGGVDIQTANYVHGILIICAAIKGYSHVKTNTPKHRKWMLRTVAYTASSVTAKIIRLISGNIIGRVGSYYTIWTCAEVQFLQTMGKGVPDFASTYPACVVADPSNVRLAIQASLTESPVNKGSAAREVMGMSLFVALLLHSLGIEIYIRLTDATHQPPRGFLLRPRGASLEQA
ncbi:hypothetical protein FRB94_009817 [Tulasnella sp. JGI-2019a]|nr:hypothetical protein FRB93_006054 [Tulasnella sp. JGI-2019a]KAG8994520.1 hypothetical protein FRB94_009817 [Tulasnella sp. JGI-2019a]KAG9025806.1 hypothetical protein FRB95_009758 [Tulasnella sp. JGI-2019a]